MSENENKNDSTEAENVKEPESTNAEKIGAEKIDADIKVGEGGTDAVAKEQPSGEMPPPPATFEALLSMLFTQSMAMLGQIPDPATGQPTVNKPYAKHFIDVLEMLGEKTKGNLSDQEKKMHSEALHAMRMAYVSVKQS
ncbi:hypothetical protein Poly51_40630 [Rubripirellula tenax]|uniref:DUF1844 domain-containing protein n=1 Tax=Rubripirellula tenax TaxID=2528015 RepID=A0A5C6ER38_9BACT|nr:DUF1844 domain-containing protein [Rubripirellula tenax]TWU50770.1 hypothetical protein Poly51_40630 [Rubripirellula tenax]